MKKILFLVLFLLAACGQEETPGEEPPADSGEPVITGYVLDMEENSALVVESTAQDFSDTGGQEEFYSAIYFTEMPEEVQLGDRVEVWAEAVAESYPGQAEAQRVEILEPGQPEGAELNEREVITRAIGEHSLDGHAAVSDITFTEGAWTVEFFSFMDEDREEVTVPDTSAGTAEAPGGADYEAFYEERMEMITEELTALEEHLGTYEDSDSWRMDFEEMSRSLSGWISSVTDKEEVPEKYLEVHASFQAAGTTIQEGIDQLSEAVAFGEEAEIEAGKNQLQEGKEELETTRQEYENIS
ncbi:DUF3221 domain-containing protein [Alkalicoccus daliensis]|uniref:Uncharacterized protein n=1 Tax=Alkalicoccus daliensis TaxID=745820 RepID=A0A1H0FRZ4_9BACI|nr:DUF3221 domain-containing protein [Alkalicoccus daliensis]SDN97415.1 Protein of unknown function [Alkalicoccus daliensis]